MIDLELPLDTGRDRREYADYFRLGQRRARDPDELEPDGDRFIAFMEALKAVSPAPVRFADIPGGRNGCYGHAENEVYVSRYISPAMTIHTALHEIVHALLHPWPGGVKPEDELPRAVRETEAEGITHLVCLSYGLDLSAYSLDYIYSWLRHLTAEEAERSGKIIRETAEKLVAAIDGELDKRVGR